MKSNTKILLSIGIVLLVITIGISFSYFVSKTTQDNLEDANTQAPTAKIPEFKLETNVEEQESLPIYPGTKNYISASVKGIKEGGEDGDTTEYQIKYRITGSVTIPEGTTFTKGEVTYKLYKTTEPIEKPIVCEDVTGTQGEEDKQTEVHYTQECDLDDGLVNPVTLTTDEHKGSIKEGTAEFTYEDVIPADNETMHYYYLVVEYPNENKDQSDDMGKGVTYSINSIVSTETGIKEPTESEKTFNQLANLACLESELKSEGVIDQNGFTSTDTSTSSCKVYEAEDNDGTSYYYRGDVQDNYVKFGKMGNDDDGEDIWWRIIRINGDGSIRMIYAGTSDNDSVPNQTNGTSVITVNNPTRFTYSPGGESFDNKYVGFQYEDGVRNGHEKDSNAKTILDTWFEENLSDEFNNGFNTLIDTNAGFCGDRSAYSRTNADSKNNEEYGVYGQVTYYGSYIRNVPRGNWPNTSSPAYPTYKCEDEENDLYTYTGSNKGTQSLEYPVGLVSADEVTYAGGLGKKDNKRYYLYNGVGYWTMSPSIYDGLYASMFEESGGAGLMYISVNSVPKFRAVINLKSGSLISGNGKATNPFKIFAD